MGTSKLTPGPWKVVEEKDDEGFTVASLYGQRQAIHAIGQPWPPERIAVLECDAGTADANLLEAAPELLEALERLAGVADTARSILWKTDRAEALRFAEDAKVARAAIAKAKGQQP